MTTPKDKPQADILAEQVYPNDSCEGLVASREQQHLRMAFANGYAAGQAAGQAAQWISVEERLPPDGSWVVIEWMNMNGEVNMSVSFVRHDDLGWRNGYYMNWLPISPTTP